MATTFRAFAAAKCHLQNICHVNRSSRGLSSPATHPLRRRRSVFGAMMASLLGGSKPVRAQAIAGTVPEVDHVSVRVVVDSYQFAVAASKKIGSVDVQHFGWGLSNDKPPSSTLISEFGLSMHAESKRGSETGNLLMDFGFTAEALNNNIRLLAVDPAELDALVLSHGHYDHFGGVVGFLQQNAGKLKAKLPLYIGGEECFCSREWVGPPVPGNFGALDRQALERGQSDGDLR